MDEFLSWVFSDSLGPDRRLVLFTVPEKRPRFFETIRDASAAGTSLARTQNVYFGLGLIQGSPSGRGRREDVAAIGSLWADIDFRSDVHANKSLPTGEADFQRLLSTLPLRPSIIVDSGQGRHLYWLLQEPWIVSDEEDRHRAANVAHGWHGLVCHEAKQLGWSIENLGELARVLRLPGTVNRKRSDDPVDVRILEADPRRRYSVEDFEPFLRSTAPAQPSLNLQSDTGPAIEFNPCVSPPADRFEEAFNEWPLFRRTWDRDRSDLLDQSASVYDLSLATLAAMRDWSDAEIASLLHAWRCRHNERPEKLTRQDYLSRTITRAREAAAQTASSQDETGVDLSTFLARQALPTSPLGVRELIEAYPLLRPPVIHGLLREGETMNVIASPKTGKSWLTLDLSIAVATGQPWLGVYETEPGPVLIIDNELHRETSAHRLPQVAEARSVTIDDLEGLIFVDSMRGRLRDIFGLASYFESLQPGEFRVIVLDAFYRFMPAGGDENDNGTMASIYNLIDSFADRLGCCFVLIHHSTKGSQSGKSVTDMGAGAGAQSRATDTHLVLRPHEEPGAVVLDAVVRSWPPIQPVCLRWSFPVWNVDDSLDPELLKPERPRRRRQPATDAKPEKPPEPEWDVDRFVETFIEDEPQTLGALYEAAQAKGLSLRRTKNFLQHAESTNRVYRWKFGASRAVEISLIRQPEKESSDEPN